ncbi:hypothetical protein N9Q18_00495 [bacterium]|jgi:hypothetical protein|nr:hypothetical protein [bacterium]
MADSDPLSQMFNLFAAPLAGAVQSFEQFRNGVDQFQRGVENFNRTMENLNETAERMNVLLAEVEEPLRAAVPQVTRTVKTADEMMKVVSGPAIAVAPGLQVLAETLNNPAIKQMPNQMAQMNEVLAEVTARLAPLGQFAESAGGLFGGLKLPGFGGSPKPIPAVPVPELDDAVDNEPAAIRITRKATTARKAPARKKNAAKKKTTAKKTTARKNAAKKTAGKNSAAKKS